MNLINPKAPLCQILPVWLRTVLFATTVHLIALSICKAETTETQPDLSELRRQIEELNRQVELLQFKNSASTISPEYVPAPIDNSFEVVDEEEWFDPYRPEDLSDFLRLPRSDVSIRIDGYVKGDFIHDFDAILETDRFNVYQIPTDGRDGSNTRFHARETRLIFEARRPTSWGESRAFIEGDFFPANRNDFRLRHAFAELGPILVGQTWTAVTHIEALPETVDFETPTAFIVKRPAQFRWTHDINSELEFTCSLEEPNHAVADPNSLIGLSIDGEQRESSPDYTARLRYTCDYGQLQLAGIIRQFGFQPEGGPINTETGAAVISSGVINLTEDQMFKFQLESGEGIGSFRGALDATPDNNGVPDLIDYVAGTLGHTKQWNEHWRSTAVYSFGRGDTTEFQTDRAVREVQYFAVNLFWLPFEGTRCGIEYLYGTREDKDGSTGHANRIQAGVWLNLN